MNFSIDPIGTIQPYNQGFEKYNWLLHYHGGTLITRYHIDIKRPNEDRLNVAYDETEKQGARKMQRYRNKK